MGMICSHVHGMVYLDCEGHDWWNVARQNICHGDNDEIASGLRRFLCAKVVVEWEMFQVVALECYQGSQNEDWADPPQI